MTKRAPQNPPPKLVRNPRTGRYVEVRGVGALKGQLTIKRGVDLTKPIFEQVSKDLGRESGSLAAKS